MTNPIIAVLRRADVVESLHRGAYAVSDAGGAVIAKAGAYQEAFFPRSAIKAFQCLPLIESGAANDLVRANQKPLAVHNNCSGKHAGMLTLAKHLGASLEGYVLPGHPVQLVVADCLSRYCGVDVSKAPRGIDGCSVPTWAVPMDKLALAFAKLCDPANAGAQWIIRAARAHPFLIAGTGRFDTKIMQAVPRLFIKVGAEGVFCGCIPHAGLGFALKCDDGATRGAEVAVAQMLAHLNVWTDAEKAELEALAREPLHNWRKLYVGELQAALPS